jgi:hypothetical protein
MLYKYNISDVIDKDMNTYGKRTVTNANEELIDYINDYNSISSSKIYLANFINLLQNNTNMDVSKYIQADYYKKNIENDKDTFIKNIKNAIIISDPAYSYHYIEYSSKYLDKDGHNVIKFKISVYKKGFKYSFGYDILQYEENKDANKKMLIEVVEYSPYNFKVTFPSEATNEE